MAKKQKVFHVLCTTSGSDGDPQYAVIQLTVSMIKWLLSRLLLVKVLKTDDPQCYALTYFNYNANYYDKNPSPSRDDEDIQSGDFVILARAPRATPIRTMADTVVITEDTVHWCAAHKHSGGEFETDTITAEQLAEYQEQLERVS